MVHPSVRRAWPMVFVALAALAPAAWAQVATRNFDLKSARNDYPPSVSGIVNYSACWSYIHSDGREYAAIGVNGTGGGPAGTAIYNVTDPANATFVGFITGPASHWREMKSYRDWLYVVSEGQGANQGVQIIRMTDPDHPVLAGTYVTNFVTSHSVSVDTTRGLLVCNGTRAANGIATGMRILALNSNGGTPEAPVEAGWWPGGALPVSDVNYVHDSMPVGNRIYAASIYAGYERVLDDTNPAAPFQVNAWTYPGGFTHNSWPDATGQWLYVTDEVKGQPLKVFNIANVMAPVQVDGITSNPQAIVHNAHVLGNELYLSNYTEGIRALDLSDPSHPAEFGWADSYPGASGGYSGVWEVCPYFPSGTVIASDRNSGLYVYRPVRNYGILRARVVDAANGLPLAGVRVSLTVQGDSLTTPSDGLVAFAPSPGSHTVRAHLFGWTDATATRTVSMGSSDSVTLAIALRPTATFAGTIRNSANNQPLDAAEVSLAYTPVHEHTGPNGQYTVEVPDDLYRLEIRRGGFVPLAFDRRIGPGFPGHDYSLVPAPVWVDMETNPGWTVGAAGDNAITGIWTRVIPLGTGTRTPGSEPSLAAGGDVAAARERRAPGPMHCGHCEEHEAAFPEIAPFMDHTPGAGTMCFVTGQGTDSAQVDQADVDGGVTTLTTPALDATGMATPTIDFWRWFESYWSSGLSSGTNGPDPSDYLAVLISNDNGANWTVVDTTRGENNHWAERSIRVADYLTPTTLVKLRFVCADIGPASLVEAAIDDLTLFDGASQPADVRPHGRGGPKLAFRAPAPNPTSGAVQLVLDLPEAADVVIDVVDVGGRRVCDLYRGHAGAGPLTLVWDGRNSAGHEASAGLYFARAHVGARQTDVRIARVR